MNQLNTELIIDLDKERDIIIDIKAQLKKNLPNYKEVFAQVEANIRLDIEQIKAQKDKGLSVIPEINYADVVAGNVTQETLNLIKQRGVVVVRNVFARERMQQWNNQIVDYIDKNDYYTKAQDKAGIDQYFGTLKSGKPQIFGLYWSKPQMEVRQSEELAKTRAFINQLWIAKGVNEAGQNETYFDIKQECTYADRVRRREPGDRSLGLSLHVDAGTIERWIDDNYRQVFRHIFNGNWQDFNPWDGAYRTQTREIPSPAVCHMFRTFQGWTALTPQGPGEGTLQVVPVARVMTYILLRALQDDVPADSLCGCKPGRALSIESAYHELLMDGVVNIPQMHEGDTVWWHPDVLHAVDDVHNGKGYSNVIYIGSAPACEKNKAYLPGQRASFLAGNSPPDFAPENYEIDFVDRATEADLTPLGRLQMGFE